LHVGENLNLDTGGNMFMKIRLKLNLILFFISVIISVLFSFTFYFASWFVGKMPYMIEIEYIGKCKIYPCPELDCNFWYYACCNEILNLQTNKIALWDCDQQYAQHVQYSIRECDSNVSSEIDYQKKNTKCTSTDKSYYIFGLGRKVFEIYCKQHEDTDSKVSTLLSSVVSERLDEDAIYIYKTNEFFDPKEYPITNANIFPVIFYYSFKFLWIIGSVIFFIIY
jgi:hypothetical protein